MWELLESRLSAAFHAVAGVTDPVLTRSQRADFQANGALALGASARESAARVAASAELSGVAQASVSGPGFINLTLLPSYLESLLTTMAGDDRLGVATVRQPQRILVDYAGPNVAKQMHVGHLRSAVIGDCLARVLSHCGHEVQGVSHIGDWGTPFGMVLEQFAETGSAHLDELYQAARKRFDGDPEFAARSRLRVVAMQSGDPETMTLWHALVAVSRQHFLAVNERLGLRLTLEDHVGESFYRDQLGDVADELRAKGLLRFSQGAWCVFPDGYDAPLIVIKSDGGYTYAATDLAAIRYRSRRHDRIVYVLGAPQRGHLGMVFAVARQAGWIGDNQAEHVAFGSVLGTDGRMLRSRSGESVKLVSLLDEALARASELTGDPAVARAVSVGAVKYADLSSHLGKDYVFDLDRMVSFTGDTAGYLQFARARAAGVLAKSPESPGPFVIGDGERGLALELLSYPRAVAETAQTLEPHRLAGYLRRLAVAFTGFLETCPVLRAPEGEVRAGRLALCELTGRTLVAGLDLLGIDAPRRM